MSSRQAKELLFAFFGEYFLDERREPIRASALISVLRGADIAAPATRATLDRLVQSDFLVRERRGREIVFSLTGHGRAVLREATLRVRGPHPFDPNGDGWTLVTFSIPEDYRQLRHRLRATLTWEGFAPLRDGLWLAPGEVDLDASVAPVRDELSVGALLAFHARELPGFSIAEAVHSAWDIDAIRAAHDAFIACWTRPPQARTAIASRVMLVADWLALLRIDPRLPAAFMDSGWPAATSVKIYHRMRDQLELAARDEFAYLVTDRTEARSIQPQR
ncbi:PaaX family transcriptional regulator [Parafrigoribacterium humi]|uniref:PaaX family transcriptional regulator n=1 Tax=Parafrigoribacterium humi TaxID=3144664 RepID=UPI0032F0105F